MMTYEPAGVRTAIGDFVYWSRRRSRSTSVSFLPSLQRWTVLGDVGISTMPCVHQRPSDMLLLAYLAGVTIGYRSFRDPSLRLSVSARSLLEVILVYGMTTSLTAVIGSKR